METDDYLSSFKHVGDHFMTGGDFCVKQNICTNDQFNITYNRNNLNAIN